MTETAVGSGVLNRPAAARFVAIGLSLIVIFGAFAVIFVINGVQLFRSAARLPLPTGAESQRRGRALRMGFGVTFASEGVVIAVVWGIYMLRVKRAIMAALDESLHPVSQAS